MSMFDDQNFIDLNDNRDDPKSWLQDPSSPPPPSQRPPPNSHSQSVAAAAASGGGEGGVFDKVLYKNLVEMLPLVESIMDRRVPNASFSRRASVAYTKTPSNLKKATDPKARKVAQSIPSKKKRDFGDNDTSKNDEFSIFTSGATTTEKDRVELVYLQEKVKNLERQLSEKDELLKSAEVSQKQMSAVHAKVDEMKRQVEEKESLIKSAQIQLTDAKIKLADKQASLEKLQWESTTSNSKVQKLQEDLDSSHDDISSFMVFVEGLSKTDAPQYVEDYDITPCHLNHVPYIDDMDQRRMQEMEEAREAYISTVAAAKESQDEDALEIALKARMRLQSYLLTPPKITCNGESPHNALLS